MQVDLRRIEETILHAEVDVVGDRIANAGDQLEGKAAVAVADAAVIAVDQHRAGRADRRVIGEETGPDLGIADAGADIAIEAGVVAEIEQAVDHGRKRARPATDIDGCLVADKRHNQSVDVDVTNRRALVRKLAFEAEHAKIIAADDVGIEPGLVVDDVSVVDGRPYEIAAEERRLQRRILNQHRAAFDPGVPRMVASDRRGGQGGRSERHRNG